MNSIITHINRLILILLPETRFFGFKRFLFTLQGCKIGKNTRICSSVKIFGAGNVTIGNNVWIGPEVILISSSSIFIDDNVDIGPCVFMGTGSHVLGDLRDRMAGTGLSKDIIIRKGCWLGSKSLIMPGVTIDAMSVVNAGSIVTKTHEPNSLLAGIPAKVVKKIYYVE